MRKKILEDCCMEVEGCRPAMPPVIETLVDTAPEELKDATALACLAPLGVVGCQLQAKYINGELHSPIFQTSIVGPQACGKGHLNKIAEMLLAPVSRCDDQQEQSLLDYMAQFGQLKGQGMKEEDIIGILGLPPQPIIRDLGARVSTTAMMELMRNAQGLAVILRSEEAHSLVKSWTSRNTDISDMLRIGFDEGRYRQNLSSRSGAFSGKVNLRIANSICGTPGAFDQLFPSEENGAVGRQLFVLVDDSLDREVPVWRDLTEEELAEINRQLDRLDAVSIRKVEIGWEVQPKHLMDLDYAREHMMEWFERHRKKAAAAGSYSRRTFIKRDAVMGFRSAMLAHFLWGEPTDDDTRKKVCRFAEWVAEKALRGHLSRYTVAEDRAEDFFAKKPYDTLGNTFTTADVGAVLGYYNLKSSAKDVVSKWKRDKRVVFEGEMRPTPYGPKRVYRKVKSGERELLEAK